MESGKILRNSQIIFLGLFIAAGTIISTAILSKALLQIKKFTSEVINVTGSAEKQIISDYATWKVSFGRIAPEITAAFSSVEKDLKVVNEYLTGKGFNSEEIIISQVYTETLYKRDSKGYSTNEIEGYRLTQTIEIRSLDVQKVTEVSRKSTELIIQGIALISDPPQYFYTKLSTLKLEMLAQATEDAKNRAEQMAKATGSKVGAIRSADMGVFQITPVNSYEVSSWGVNDTSSLEKKVTAVVHADFGVSK
jgi:hypothetical protein